MHRFTILTLRTLCLSVLCLVVSCGGPLGGGVPIYTVERGEFVNSITVTGELEAVRSQVIIAPVMKIRGAYPKIAQIVDDGQRVEKGEQLVQFDPSIVE